MFSVLGSLKQWLMIFCMCVVSCR